MLDSDGEENKITFVGLKTPLLGTKQIDYQTQSSMVVLMEKVIMLVVIHCLIVLMK